MYPNVSECVKTSPNGPENVKKLRENVEKLRGRWHGGAVKFSVLFEYLGLHITGTWQLNTAAADGINKFVG